MERPTFCWESIVPFSPPHVFAWHERPGAFERFNPPWRPVRVVKSPASLRDGAQVAIQLPILGPIALRWELSHRDYRENAQFCDEQVRGPFRVWKHQHLFIPEGASSCRMRDEIYYQPPLGLSPLIPLVNRELQRLFHFRHMALTTDLSLHARWKEQPKKRILISGASGFIGSALTAFLSTGGHSVIRLVRRPTSHPDERFWNPDSGELSPDVFRDIDVVIHLGGENLLAKRWDASFKKTILESRVNSSRLLCATIANLPKKPEVVIMASGVGFYGDTGSTIVDESSPRGRGFLAETCNAWEESAHEALHNTTRLVHLRISTVFNAKGGALKKMLPAFSLGVAGVLGSGKQFMSWIALQDLLGIVEHVIYTPSVAGAVNAASPHAVTNKEFTKVLGAVLHRSTIVPTPASLVRLLFGDVADEALLASNRVVPTALVASGYQFVFPELREALQFECGISPQESSTRPPSSQHSPRP